MQRGQRLTFAHCGAELCWHKLSWVSYSGSEKSRSEAVCYQANIGTQPLRVITQKTHSDCLTDCLVPGLPYLLSSSPLLPLKKKKKNSQKVTSLNLLSSVFEWGWKKFWKRRESPFVWTDKVWRVKRSLLWIWTPPQTAWEDFFFSLTF